MPADSTYRVQLHAGFGFGALAEVAPYLADLGVTEVYCSPYLQAAPGSTHGYDVVDPTRFNEELGGEGGYVAMVDVLRAHGLRQVLDIVPNHMATDRTNPWWWDVLKNGPASRHAPVFDIDWAGPDPRFAFTVLVPVLGDHYGRVIDAGELAVERRGGEFVVRYFDSEWPVSPRTIDGVLTAAGEVGGFDQLKTLGHAFADLPSARLTAESARRERHEQERALASTLGRLCDEEPAVAAAVDAQVAAVNADADRLDQLLRRQNYRLAFWRTAAEELDYRRFFNIESLVGVRVEDPDVFTATHQLVVDLVARGDLDGLRVDHIDGLRDPRGYLTSLAEVTGGVHTVVEKILEPGEGLPETWPVAGTSGYDFLTRVNNLFVATEHEPAMTCAYQVLAGASEGYEEVVYRSKVQVLRQELTAEVDRLAALAAEVCERYRRHRDHTRREVRNALRELVARFPVYRTYVRPGDPVSEADRARVAQAVSEARAGRPDLDAELFGFLGQLALGDRPGDLEWEFAQRLPQLTAPTMAKGVEDTAFYRYHRLVSLNEVGGNPGVFGRPVDAFHDATARTAAQWPETMLTLSTHDTKRSADVRARLNVLSEDPDAWASTVERWLDRTARYRTGGWPDAPTLYLFFQTVVGAWPIDADRLVAYLTKATREAKVHTSWVDPDPDYDAAVEHFVRSVIADEGFGADLQRFLGEHRMVERGRRNSVAQTTLLFTCPGRPDLYQGDELWDLSLVDPDNRRPVDYRARRDLLGHLPDRPDVDLGRDDAGVTKLWLIRRLLGHRAERPDAYAGTTYEPLRLAGPGATHVVAFTRGDLCAVVPTRSTAPGPGTEVFLPRGRWTAVLSGKEHEAGRRSLAELTADFPVAVLERARS